MKNYKAVTTKEALLAFVDAELALIPEDLVQSAAGASAFYSHIYHGLSGVESSSMCQTQDLAKSLKNPNSESLERLGFNRQGFKSAVVGFCHKAEKHKGALECEDGWADQNAGEGNIYRAIAWEVEQAKISTLSLLKKEACL